MSTDRRIADLLTRDEIRAFTARSNLGGMYAVLSTWLVIAACLAMVAWQPLTFPLAVVILGGRQLALAILMHEAAHRTLFRTRWIDDHVVDWLCARPVWSDVKRYREHHLGHHAHTGTERDPDLGLAFVKPMSKRSFRRKVIRDLSGASGLRRIIGLLAMDAEIIKYDVGGGVQRAPKRHASYHLAKLAKNLVPMLLVNAAMFAILYMLGIGWVYLAWVVAWMSTYSLFLRIRSLAEHACLEHTDDSFANTRTTYASILARITVAPFFVNFHLEHHLIPTVPWFRLPALRKTLETRTELVPATPNYGAVLAAVTRP